MVELLIAPLPTWAVKIAPLQPPVVFVEHGTGVEGGVPVAEACKTMCLPGQMVVSKPAFTVLTVKTVTLNESGVIHTLSLAIK